jgi:hypothetical protein
MTRGTGSRSVGATLVALLIAGAASATTWLVPGDGSNVCTIGSPNCDTIQQAVTAAAANDTIQIAAGTFSGAGNFGVVLDKTLTVVGAGRANTTVQPDAGAFGFSIRADDVVVSDLAIAGGASGITCQNAPADNALITRVDFSNSTSRGIDVSTAGVGEALSNASVVDCTFTSVNIGIRLSSNSQVNGLAISETTFSGNNYGVYGANDGNSSTLVGLAVSDCTFTNQTQYAIYAEEMRQSTIEGSTFTNNRVAIQLLKLYAAALPAGDITIDDNQFSGHTFTTINLEVPNSGLDNPIAVTNNTITLDVGTLAFNAAGIFVGLGHAFTHAGVTISGNTISLAGTFGSATAAFGVRLRRNGPVTLTDNTLDGGDVGGSGTTPATSGLYIESNSSAGAMPASATITASCNQIGGFRNGVSVFDSAGGAYGGLAAGATVTLSGNDIAGNADVGVINGAGSQSVDAQSNWWGCAAGPGNLGCDGVSGPVDASNPSTVAAPCDNQCSPAPQSCRAASKSILLLKDKADPAGDKLVWKWLKGEPTSQMEFADPTTTANYTLCIYAGSTAALVGDALIPADATKWSTISTKGYKYKDPAGSADSITKVILKGSTENKSKVLVKGKGAGLPDLTLPIEAPVTVQLRNVATGICWGADYSMAQLLKNQEGLLKGKAQ